MKRFVLSAVVVLLVVGWLCQVGVAQVTPLPVGIVVAPSTLNLQSNSKYVTVHAEIEYAAVWDGTVELNGMPAAFIKADACGDLVAKFYADEVKANVEGLAEGIATMVLTGESDYGLFSGMDDIRVIDRGGKHGNRFGR